MSSLPGLRMEDFLMWNYNLVVHGESDANWSRMAAEAIGASLGARHVLTQEEFAPLVAMFEPHREEVERKLSDFDEENQSWRTYASYNFDFISVAENDQGHSYLLGVVDNQPTQQKLREQVSHPQPTIEEPPMSAEAVEIHLLKVDLKDAVEHLRKALHFIETPGDFNDEEKMHLINDIDDLVQGYDLNPRQHVPEEETKG